MSDEKLELIEELLWQLDPPENEDEEVAEEAQNSNANEPVDEVDDLAPLDDGDIKPTNVDPG